MLSTVWLVVGGWFPGLVCRRRPSPRSHAQSILYTPNVATGRAGRRPGSNAANRRRGNAAGRRCSRPHGPLDPDLGAGKWRPAATPGVPGNPQESVAAGKGNPFPRQRPAGRNPGRLSLKLRALVFMLANMSSVIPVILFRSIPESCHSIFKLKDTMTKLVAISWYSLACRQSCAKDIGAMRNKALRLLSQRLPVLRPDLWFGLRYLNFAPSGPRPEPPATCRSGGSG